MTRVYNFAAGPGALPLPVLEEVAREMVDYKGAGMSILEMSHRGKIVTQIHSETIEMIRKLLSVPDDFEVLFLQGGGHTQFAMVPLNLAASGAKTDYIVNGVWSKKAAAEASKYTQVRVFGAPDCATTPIVPASEIDPDAAYLYYCQNETVHGLEFNHIPEAPEGVTLATDVSSNFMTRPIDFKRHGLVFAGAQKNFGPAGLTVVMVRRDLLGHAQTVCPTMLDYGVHAKGNSMYNTPPVFAIYVANLVCKWLLEQGGVEEMDRRARLKSACLYRAIDASEGFYVNRYAAECRSRMNVVFTLKDETLNERFIEEAAAEGITNIKGHRILGGMRASVYNAVPVEAAQALAAFMEAFAKRNG